MLKDENREDEQENKTDKQEGLGDKQEGLGDKTEDRADKQSESADKESENAEKKEDKAVEIEDKTKKTLIKYILENKKRQVELITLVLMVILNIAGAILNKTNIMQGGLNGLINGLTLLTYVELVDSPLASILFLIVAQSLSFILQFTINHSISESFLNMGTTFPLTFIAFFIHYTIISKKATNKGDKLSDKLKKAISYKQEPYRVKFYVRLIIYPSILTVVLTLANDPVILSELGNNQYVRLYGAFTLIALPLIKILSLLTTSILAYEILTFQLILEVIALSLSITIGKLPFLQCALYIIELYVFIYCMKNINRKDNTERKNKRHDKKKTKQAK